MSNPFALDDETAWQTWRMRKLAAYPARIADLRVEVARLDQPSDAERQAILARVAAWNLALVQTAPEQIEPAALLAFGQVFGLRRADTNHFADVRSVSHIARTDAAPDDAAPDGRGDYIPYTDRPLSWHTDGYYNPPDAQVRALLLFCRRPAREGGENGLIDHELVYLRLRESSPELLAPLFHPEAFTIPAHVVAGRVIRPASVGPVFSIQDGALHMRYSARTRNVSWRDTPDTAAARAALTRLFSDPAVFTFNYRLQSGEGLISSNILHNRTGFVDDPAPERRRLLYRARYLDRIAQT